MFGPHESEIEEDDVPISFVWSGPNCGSYHDDPKLKLIGGGWHSEFHRYHAHPPCGIGNHEEVTIKVTFLFYTDESNQFVEQSGRCFYIGAESGTGEECGLGREYYSADEPDEP